MQAYELMYLLKDVRCDAEVRLGGVSGQNIALTGSTLDAEDGFIEFEVTAEECEEEEEAEEDE